MALTSISLIITDTSLLSGQSTEADISNSQVLN